MAVYWSTSTSNPDMILSFSVLTMTEKLQPMCTAPWRSTTKQARQVIGTVTSQAWAINHEASWGDQKAVLAYNGTSTPCKHSCVLRYNLADVDIIM